MNFSDLSSVLNVLEKFSNTKITIFPESSWRPGDHSTSWDEVFIENLPSDECLVELLVSFLKIYPSHGFVCYNRDYERIQFIAHFKKSMSVIQRPPFSESSFKESSNLYHSFLLYLGNTYHTLRNKE